MGLRNFINSNKNLPPILHANIVESSGRPHKQQSDSAATSRSNSAATSRNNSASLSAYEVPIQNNKGRPYAAALELWSLTR
jgi:hypothetical protein